MFIGVTVIDEYNVETIANVNTNHIVSTEPINPRNFDEGTYIYLKDSRRHETRIPIYDLQLRIKKCQERFAAIIMVNYIAENLPEPKKKRNVRKTDV